MKGSWFLKTVQCCERLKMSDKEAVDSDCLKDISIGEQCLYYWDMNVFLENDVPVSYFAVLGHCCHT